jgi:uncharacterized repeat protein (TIGR01451 family)
MMTQAVRDPVGMADGWRGNAPRPATHRAAAAAAVRARAWLPLVGMLLLLGWGTVAPARAITTIIDTPVNGPLTINAGDRVEIHTGGSVTSATTGITVNAGGELIILDGAVSGTNGSTSMGVRVIGGTLTLSSGTVDGGANLGGYGVFVSNGGTVTISGGSVYANTGVYLYSGTVSIPGGNVYGNEVGVEVNGGTATLSGGRVSGGSAGLLVDGGMATLSSGTVFGSAGVKVTSGEASITGGTVGNGADGVIVNGGRATISGGSVSGYTNGVVAQAGPAIISGGSVSGPIGVLANGGSATISGGSVSGNIAGVKVASYGIAILSGGSISGGTYGLVVSGNFATIRGCNLLLAGTILSGILQDGTVVNMPVSLYAPGVLSLDSATTQITCPANQTVPATSTAGAVVTYPAPTVAYTCGSPVQVTCQPASGATFPVGATPVTCTVTDVLSNSTTCNFTVTVLPTADLAVVMAATSKKVNTGQTLTYTIVVNNGGPHSADNAVVQDILPAGFVFQSATTTQGTLQTPAPGATGTLTASLGSLAPGGSATVRITGSFSVRKSTENTASVSASGKDPNLTNNQATVKVIVN